MAGFVLANGSMSSNQSGEGDIRRALIEADREMSNSKLRIPNSIDSTSIFTLHPSNFATVLPGQLSYSMQIPVCLWFLSKSKAARVIKSSDRSTPTSVRGGRHLTPRSCG
jgi:type I restriction enzyme M protein